MKDKICGGKMEERFSVIRLDKSASDAVQQDFLNEFTMLPFQLYKGCDAWVPPIISEYKKYITGQDNNLNTAGPNAKFIVREKMPDGSLKTAGRILVGRDDALNNYKGTNDGYISQFECIDDYECAEMLLDAAGRWFKSKDTDRIKGPLSLPGGEDNRGFITDNFEDPTAIMNTYNKPYYNDFFVRYGFEKYADCYAFETDLEDMKNERYEMLVPLAMKRYKFRLDHFNLKDPYKDAADIKKIIEQALPQEWEDFMPLTTEDVNNVVAQLIDFVVPEFLFIARNEADEPIGFNITLPDYNQVLKKMNGKLGFWGTIKFLFYRRKINRLRTFVLYVIPKYRKKGVSNSMYLQTYINARKRGYKKIEGSTIWDYNLPMLNDILKTGAKKSKTYRIYKMNLK